MVEAPEGPARTAAIGWQRNSRGRGLKDQESDSRQTGQRDADNLVRVTVAWGSPEQSELKANILRALLAKTKNKWIDVRLPSTPTSAQSSPIPAPPPSPSRASSPVPRVTKRRGCDPNRWGVVPSSLSPSPTVHS